MECNPFGVKKHGKAFVKNLLLTHLGRPTGRFSPAARQNYSTVMLNSASEANGCDESKPLSAINRKNCVSTGLANRMVCHSAFCGKAPFCHGLAPVLAVGTDVDSVIFDPAVGVAVLARQASDTGQFHWFWKLDNQLVWQFGRPSPHGVCHIVSGSPSIA